MPKRRILFIFAYCLFAISSALVVQPGVDRSRRFGNPIEGATESELADFREGRRLFAKTWTPEVGKKYNSVACFACHVSPSLGGITREPVFLVGFLQNEASPSGWDAQARLQAIPDGKSIDLKSPPNAQLRRPLPLYGDGLLEAIPESEIRKLADPDDRNRDGVSGRVFELNGKIGRFGWKLGAATVEDFVRTAFHNEIGIEPKPVDGPDNLTEAKIEMVIRYAQMLAPPIKPLASPLTDEGKALFIQVGCGSCHVPVWKTGKSTIAALSEKTFEPYTDLLLHDVGPGKPEKDRSKKPGPREFRTTPLWGLRGTGGIYWHDLSVNSVEEAIMTHQGEAENVRKKFEKLNEVDRAKLISFVESL